MGHARTLRRPRQYDFLYWGLVWLSVSLLRPLTGSAQMQAAAKTPETGINQELNKYPGLLPEFGRLLNRFQHEIQFPAPRSQSRLLPLLPDSIQFYAAFPNYGDASHHALEIFQEELRANQALRDWWRHSDLGPGGPKAEQWLEKFYELSRYLGDEIVISGGLGSNNANALMLAEVSKPGFKSFLQQAMGEMADKSRPPLRVLDLPELATARDQSGSEPIVLVRPDLVVVASDVAALRSFNSKLDSHTEALPSTAFGKRLMRSYEGGVTTMGAIDLQRLLGQVPLGPPKQAILQRTGFDETKYAVWEHKSVDGQTVSQGELSFTGPRHGIAAWLAQPASLGSLEFVSPKALLAASVLLSNPAQIYDDVKELATSSNPDAFAMVTQIEQGLNLRVKDDLLSLLAGEITLELDSATPPQPAWKAILRVKDASRLQQTLSTLLATAGLPAEASQEGEFTYYRLRTPSPKGAVEIGYAFVDGYLIVASSRDAITGAARLHRTGESLGKSASFLASLPPGHLSGVSALLYEDPAAMMSWRLGQLSPQLAESLAPVVARRTPLVVCAYGEENAIREATTSTSFDPAAVLIVAAVAIPNLLRARTAANESGAVGTLRMVNMAEVTYSATYSGRGYATDLATLGPDPTGSGTVSSHHAGLIDSTLGNPTCTSAAWCTQHGYQFRVTSACKQQPCKQFVAVATPVTTSMGTRSYCSTSDAVIRFKLGPPIPSVVSASECRSWTPIQ